MYIRLALWSVIMSGCASAAVGGSKLASPALVEANANLAGTWRCTGSVFGPEGASPSEASLEVAPFLDGAWLQSKLAVTSGKYHYKFDAFRSFNATTQTWTSVIIDNLGGHAASSSGDAIAWTGKATSPMGTMDIRDTETFVSQGELKMLGQYSQDGSTWSTGYDLICRR